LAASCCGFWLEIKQLAMLTAIERRLPLAWRRPVTGPIHAEGPFAGLKPLTIVTGGSEGIGLAIARRFAAAGHGLLLVARNQERLETAAAQIRAAHAVEVLTLAVDVTHADAPEAIDMAVAGAGGYAHILVNSAGIGMAGPFSEQPAETLSALVDLNVRALTLLMRHILPGMRQRGSGGVINLASLGGYVPGPWQAAYYASKAYVVTLSEAVAAEVARDGVRVCVVAPGPVDTEFHGRMHAETAFYRLLIPPLTPDGVAAYAYRGFQLGLRVIVPGLFNMAMALVLRVAPHRLSVPIVGWLLKPRGQEKGNA
jgi:short-subunit dehydrogenase